MRYAGGGGGYMWGVHGAGKRGFKHQPKPKPRGLEGGFAGGMWHRCKKLQQARGRRARPG